MNSLTFKCYRCGKASSLTLTTDERGEVRRLRGEEKVKKTFLCEHCGYANEIEIDITKAGELLDRLSSTDPEGREVIASARRGDLSRIVEIAKGKFRL